MKTTTLADRSGNPTLITCPGHVGREKFNAAMDKEWQGDHYSKNEWERLRRYEFYIPSKTRQWKCVDAGTKGSKKFTTIVWE